MPRDDAFDVGTWLEGLGLGTYGEAFRANHVDAGTLALLTAEDLAAMGVASVGHRRRILAAAAQGAAEAAERPVERRILTVMFVDLVDSTALSASLDVEDYLEVIARFQRDAGEVLRAHGGHVAQLLGDGVMASFGYPASTEHAAERAVAAALAVLDGAAQLSPERGGPPIRLRIGVATGLAVVGGAGQAAAPGAGTAIGETPNLAARLQAAAEPGSVVISAKTRSLIGELFDCEDLGERALRGLAGPVRLWRVKGRSRAATRFEALRAPQRRAPFMGRDAELSALLSHLACDAPGEAGVALVTGEPGLGKSRLVRRALALGRPEAVGQALALQGSPYGIALPFHPIRYVLLRACDLAEGGPPEAVQAEVAAHLAAIGIDDAEAAPLLATVLDPGTLQEHSANLGPAEARARLKRVLSDYLARRAEACRALVIEDAGWLDPSTIELLAELLPRLRAEGVPVVATARPDELLADWLSGPEAMRVRLDRLPPAEITALVEAIAGARVLAPGLVEAIVARSDGVPVFAEELTWGYLDGVLGGTSGDELAQVPLTLAESLLSRLDRLSHGRKLASLAAAIGREFPVALLAAVAGLPEADVREDVAELVVAGILQKGHSRFGEAVRFRHSLVRDAAYELLLHREHAPLHRRIADILEADFPEIAQALPPVVAIQRAHAGQWAASREAWARAAQGASLRSAHAEAAESLGRAIEAGKRCGTEPEHDAHELALRLERLGALVCASGYRSEPVDRETECIVALSARLGDAASVVPALQARWVQLASEGNAQGALEIALQTREAAAAATLAERLVAERLCGTSLLFSGRLSEAMGHYQAFFDLYDPEIHAEAMRNGHTDHAVAALIGMAEAHVLRGKPGLADPWRQRALEAARRSGRVHDLGLALTYAGCLHAHLMGRIDEVSAFAAELAGLVIRHAMPNWIGYRDLFEGLVAIRRREGVSGVDAVRSGVGALLESRAFAEWWLVLAAGGCVEAGDWAAAEEMLALSRPRVEKGWLRLGVEHHRLTALVQERRGETEGAAASLREARDLAGRQGSGLLGARLGTGDAVAA